MNKYFPAFKYINIPNILTSVGISIGLLNIFLILQSHIKASLIIQLSTILIDDLDGFYARKLKQETELGENLDTLGDALNNIIYPVIAAFSLGFNQYFSIFVLILFLLAGFWRFSSYATVTEGGKDYCTGFSSGTALCLFIFILAFSRYFTQGISLNCILFAFFSVTSLLMLSSIRYIQGGLTKIITYIFGVLSILILCFDSHSW